MAAVYAGVDGPDRRSSSALLPGSNPAEDGASPEPAGDTDAATFYLEARGEEEVVGAIRFGAEPGPPTDAAEGRARWRAFLRERFVRGADTDFAEGFAIDGRGGYDAVDRDEGLDVLERRDAEEAWYDDQDPGWLDENGSEDSDSTLDGDRVPPPTTTTGAQAEQRYHPAVGRTTAARRSRRRRGETGVQDF